MRVVALSQALLDHYNFVYRDLFEIRSFFLYLLRVKNTITSNLSIVMPTPPLPLQ